MLVYFVFYSDKKKTKISTKIACCLKFLKFYFKLLRVYEEHRRREFKLKYSQIHSDLDNYLNDSHLSLGPTRKGRLKNLKDVDKWSCLMTSVFYLC